MAPCGQPLLIPCGIEREAGRFEAVQVIGDPCAEGSDRDDHFPARTGQGLFDAGRFGRTDGAPHQPVALEAAQRHGKGRGHPARPNRAACLSYACAKRLGLRLLHKGEDFARIDLA